MVVSRGLCAAVLAQLCGTLYDQTLFVWGKMVWYQGIDVAQWNYQSGSNRLLELLENIRPPSLSQVRVHIKVCIRHPFPADSRGAAVL